MGKKKWCVLIAAAAALLLFNTFGWLDDGREVLEYVAEHYDIGGSRIVDGEYVSTNGNGMRGYKTFWLFTEDGEKHLGRIQVIFRRHIGRIGPEVRVTGMEVINGGE